ncbi:hypothetical protein M9458_053576 [Cirrhinus mrigala]|uniref:Uncharacterized protein n=1 Tax=Cirrhinus mrigala TaxID=683832 RepID=A0ABD0MPL2_CIRMR
MNDTGLYLQYTSRGSPARDKCCQCESTMGACCSRHAYAPLLRCLCSASASSVKPVSRVCHVSECNRCNLAGVFDFVATLRRIKSTIESRLHRMLSKDGLSLPSAPLGRKPHSKAAHSAFSVKAADLRGAASSRTHLVLQAYWHTDVDEINRLGIELWYRTTRGFSILDGIDTFRSVPKKYRTRYPALFISMDCYPKNSV